MSSAKSFRQIIGVPPSKASTSDSTLIIIDAQNEYAEGLLKLEGVEESRKVILSILEAYRKTGKNNIIHVVHDTPSGAPVFTPGTTLAEEFSELKPLAGEPLVHKQNPGSFTDTDLKKHLDAAGHNKLVIIGYMVHICVSTTTRQAAEKGYDIVLVEDAISARDIPGASAADVKRVELAIIADGFGTVIQSKELGRD